MTDMVLYADFGYPCCYLAGRGVDALADAGIVVDWRAVERKPQVSVLPRPAGVDERTEVNGELGAVAPLLLADSDFSSALPGLVPNTQAAVSAYAEAYGAGVAADARRLLLAAYWTEHADIGDPEVLRTRLVGPILRGHATSDPLQRFGYAVSTNRGPITTSAWRRIRSWREEWSQHGTDTLPTLIEDGQILTGAAAVLNRLADQIVRLGVKVNLDLPNPARYPQVRNRPSKQWISQVGGRWRHAWMDDQACVADDDLR
jgi:hypothetical protein